MRSCNFGKRGGVKLLNLTKKDDQFQYEIARCFYAWIVYLRTNVKPPLFFTNFEKTTSFVTRRSYTGGLTPSHDKQNINLKRFVQKLTGFITNFHDLGQCFCKTRLV